jgi:hypothetical protein
LAWKEERDEEISARYAKKWLTGAVHADISGDLLEFTPIAVKAQYGIENKESEDGEDEGEKDADVEDATPRECALISTRAAFF